MRTAFYKTRTIVFLPALIAFFVAQAEDCQGAETKYPTRPINFITPFSPGGTSDLAVRLLAKAIASAKPRADHPKTSPGRFTSSLPSVARMSIWTSFAART